ncbi:MAG TPA: hypothetical protein VEH27_04805, partial [Methylomirabilota bacterium]|nr:hypothetical protein [Methylomirabilota bacterium]
MNPIRKTVRRLSTWVMACLATVALAATVQAQTPEVGQGGPITINEVGKATPYPSQIVTSNILGTIERASVRLNGLTHGYPDDLDILLVSPTGKGIVLMSDAGGQFDLNGATLTFTNGAAALPDEGQINSGTFRPTDFETGDAFPDTTANTFGSDLGVLAGDSPNGTWRLYVLDDQVIDGGSLNSWTLILATTPIITPATNRVVMNEDGTATLNIRVQDSDTPANSLVLSASSANQNIITNASNAGGFTFSGTGEERTLTIKPVANASGNVTVTLGVSDGIQTTTTNITVEVAAVNDAPTATISTNNLNIVQGTLSTNLTVTVADIDSAVAGLTLNARSANQAIVEDSNIFISGSDATRSIAVAGNGAATGNTQVFIDVIDPSGASNTITLNVTVNKAPYFV